MKLRGGISGFGAVAAQAHLPGWRTRPEIQIVAVHDPVPERRHQALRLIKNVRVYEDLDLMLAGERLDFLDVASPPALHAQAARSALEAGAHVIVEKPLCLDLAEFDALAKFATANARVLMCVHNWKYSAAYRLAYEMVYVSRELGPLSYLALERARTEPAGAGASGAAWRLDPSLGGGILIDHGWHVFYLMRWLMGESPLEVSAFLGSRAGEAVDDHRRRAGPIPGRQDCVLPSFLAGSGAPHCSGPFRRTWNSGIRGRARTSDRSLRRHSRVSGCRRSRRLVPCRLVRGHGG